MLKFGAVAVDIQNNVVYGDIDHCPIEDLAESALELLCIAPKGCTAIAKDYHGQSRFYGAKKIAKAQLPEPHFDEEVFNSHPRHDTHYAGNKFSPQWYDKQFAIIS